jgi:hypothetical protein
VRRLRDRGAIQGSTFWEVSCAACSVIETEEVDVFLDEDAIVNRLRGIGWRVTHDGMWICSRTECALVAEQDAALWKDGEAVTRLPTFECEEMQTPGGGRVWRFRCPYCRRDHTHSAFARASDGASPWFHVRAGCDDGSPLTSTGYLIRPAADSADSGLTQGDE